MSFRLCQLSDKLQRLDWGNSEFVDCGEFYMTDNLNVKCCLCERDLNASDSEHSHTLIGSPQSEIYEVISKVHYLCRNCKKQCTVCGNKFQ
ncbi:hypothetical protein BH23THE1_BH23THE1_32930 [soil metagenome]